MGAEFPYNLPIWRSSYRAESPDKKYIAEIDPAYEVSMGNPTFGTLELSNGLSLPKCSPSFIWSDDSIYLAVPQFTSNWLWGVGKQRLLIIDVDRNKGVAVPQNYPLHPAGNIQGWRTQADIEPVSQGNNDSLQNSGRSGHI